MKNILLILGGILTMVVLGATLLIVGAAQESQTTPTPFDPFRASIHNYETQVQRNPSAEHLKFLQGKYEQIFADATRYAAGQTEVAGNPLPRPTIAVTLIPTLNTHTGAADGIDTILRAHPYLSRQVEYISTWLNTKSADLAYSVFAGYLRDDPEQGAILTRNEPWLFVQAYLTPTRSGAVRVIAEDGLVITLQSESGELFYFDAERESFVDEKGNLLETKLYNPIPTPIPGSMDKNLTGTPNPYPYPEDNAPKDSIPYP